MSDELKSGESLSRGIRRIARRQLNRILRRLARKPPDRDGRAIHETRKDLKKLRSLLRLVLTGIGRRMCREEDRRIRQAGRALSPMRDAEVLVNTLEQLRCCCQGTAARKSFARLRGTLLQRRRGASKRMRRNRRETAAVLRATRRRLKCWPLDKLDWRDLRRGLRRTYKQGSKAFAKFETEPLPQRLHEWRKRAKDLWHQLCILKPVQPEAIGALADQMKRLGEYLGDAHDFVLLEAAAANANMKPEELELIGRLIRVRRLKLQRAAFELGRRLYVQKPRAFARHIERHAKSSRP